MHFEYMQKVFKYPSNRLPRILAEESVLQSTYWVNDWVKLFELTGVHLDFHSPNTNWKQKHDDVIEGLIKLHWNDHLDLARRSQFHDEYCNLEFTRDSSYFEDNLKAKFITLIFKARGGLLNINGRAFKKDTIGICTICNLDEAENTFHLIGICPIFKNIRNYYFGKDHLRRDEFYDILNGQNYVNLALYLSHVLQYRNLIMNEFV